MTQVVWMRAGAPLLASLVVAALVFAFVPERGPVPADGGSIGPAAAWIDDPVPGSPVAPGMVTVVGHASAAGGIDAIELWDNGAVSDSIAAAGSVLEIATFQWEASAGLHVLAVRGHDPLAGWGPFGTSTVLVGDMGTVDDTTTPPTAPTTITATSISPTTISPTTVIPTTTATTPTVPATATTTTAPPGCPAPAVVSPDDGEAVGFIAQLSWAYDGCPVDGFRVESSKLPTFPPTGTEVLVVDLDDREATVILGCGTWYWRVAGIPEGGVAPGIWSDAGVLTVVGRGC